MTETILTQGVLDVPNISCAHCQRAITTALEPVAGVGHVAVDILAKRVRVDYDPARVDLHRVSVILADEGYPVAETVADEPSDAETMETLGSGCSCCISAS